MTLTELKYIVAVAAERHFRTRRRALLRQPKPEPIIRISEKAPKTSSASDLRARRDRSAGHPPVGEEGLVAQARRARSEADRVKAVANMGASAQDHCVSA
jgi:hypothetical protein